jgi:hypothetical protein
MWIPAFDEPEPEVAVARDNIRSYRWARDLARRLKPN